MGREIRRVDADWEHPKRADSPKQYQPMLDHHFSDAIDEWVRDYRLWVDGEHPDQLDDEYDCADIENFWEWEGIPPDPHYYLAKPFKNPTWYQVYETVSEGTPITPKFETQEELIDYLAEFGDFWDQNRGDGGWTRENAESFVGRGWAPSGVLSEGTFKTPRDGS